MQAKRNTAASESMYSPVVLVLQLSNMSCTLLELWKYIDIPLCSNGFSVPAGSESNTMSMLSIAREVQLHIGSEGIGIGIGIGMGRAALQKMSPNLLRVH